MVGADFFPNIAGYSTRLYGETKNLVELGHEVTLLVPKRNEEWKKHETIDGINIIRVYPHKKFRGLLEISRKVRYLMKGDSFDVIQAHNPHNFGLAAYLGSIGYDIPFLYELHHSDYETEKNTLIEWLTRNNVIRKLLSNLLYSQSDCVLSISKSIRENLIDSGIPGNKIMLLPNGVDTSRFKPIPKDPVILDDYKLRGKKIIMFLGKFQVWESLEKLVRIFSKITADLDDVKLMLVGDGPTRKKIERNVSELNLIDDVIITGFIPYEEIQRYYSVSDVFVLVREDNELTRDTTPIKPLEAMAMGKVVVSTDLKAIREIITNNDTGFLTSHDEDEISKKVIKILQNPIIQQKVGNKAAEYIRKERSWKSIVKKLDEKYNSLLVN